MSDIPQTVAQAFIKTTTAVPEKEAIVGADGRRYSYAELRREVERIVRALQALGYGPGDRVAVWLSNRPEWVFVEYACALLGALLVPVNARFRAQEAAYVLKTARAKALFTQPRFLTNDYLERLREVAGGDLGRGDRAEIATLPDLEHIVLIEGEPVAGTLSLEALQGRAEGSPDLEGLADQVRPDDPAWIFWTSGSTGHPKGAVLSHSSISNIWNWTTLAAEMNSEDRILTSFPIFYVGGNFWCVLAALVHGATLVMSAEFDAESIVRSCRDEQVTVLSGIPFMLKEIVHDPNFDPDAFATVRIGFFGGATMPQADIETLVERIGYEHFLQIYGMTELQGISVTPRASDPRDIQLTTCGYPLPGFELRLVDPDTEEEIDGEGTGEAWFKGRIILDYEGLTAADRAKLFTPDGYLRTGDVLHRRADGRFEFVTRVKDLIKVGGENVAAAEIERVLKDHPKVFNVQVIGIVDDRRGEIPAAFVELAPDVELTLEELRSWARPRMAPFKVPRRLRIVTADEWPRTSSAKIARFRLLELL